MVEIQEPTENQGFIAGDVIHLRLRLEDEVGVDADSIEFFIDCVSVRAYRMSREEWVLETPIRRGTYVITFWR